MLFYLKVMLIILISYYEGIYLLSHPYRKKRNLNYQSQDIL